MQLEDVTRLLSGYDTALFASLLVSILIVILGRVHLRHSSRGPRELEVQTSHIGSTPRIGGVAIFFGCSVIIVIAILCSYKISS